MRRFLTKLILFLLIPIGTLVILYFISDPYKTLKPFSLEYFDATNRDYLSSELFLMNYPDKNYDSFIFGSSRACGINTYHWMKYLPEGSSQFLFQSWSETLTGIEQKVSFIDEHCQAIKNAIILIDIPGTFSRTQIPTEALAIKDPIISGQPRWKHQLILLFDFIQKPSQWIRAIRQLRHRTQTVATFDAVSNDWDNNNCIANLTTPPKKDSLNNFSKKAKSDFLNDLVEDDSHIKVSPPLINGKMEQQLKHIRTVFGRQGTDYKIVISPGYCYSFPSVSIDDLELLESVFGKENVFNYSGKNPLTTDFNNYADPNHFGQWVGWHIIENIYNGFDLMALGTTQRSAPAAM